MPVDLDALGAVRREAIKEPPEVIFKGEHFFLPVEPDGKLIELLAAIGGMADITKDPTRMSAAAAAIGDLCKTLLGPEWERFSKLEPSLMDLMALAESFPELYGLDEGELSASPPSLPSTSER
jgi:hypothetical protein